MSAKAAFIPLPCCLLRCRCREAKKGGREGGREGGTSQKVGVEGAQ